MRIAALSRDLLDRSRLTNALGDVQFATDAHGCATADVVVVDLAHFAATIPALRVAVPGARIVGYGPHVDTETLSSALKLGADDALPRSRFFRDPSAAIGLPRESGESV